MKSVEVKFKVSRKIRDQGIHQITLLGLPQREDKKPLSFSKGVVDRITFPVKEGEETVTAVLVVGSSSSIRREHQNTAGVVMFDRLYKKLPDDTEVAVKVEVEEAVKAAIDAKDLGLIL
jgi:hypothetical protein